MTCKHCGAEIHFWPTADVWVAVAPQLQKFVECQVTKDRHEPERSTQRARSIEDSSLAYR